MKLALIRTQPWNCHKLAICLVICLISLQCNTHQTNLEATSEPIAFQELTSLPIPIKKEPPKRTGILIGAKALPLAYNPTNLSTFTFPFINQPLVNALTEHLKLLKRRKQPFTQTFDNLTLNISDLETTIELLLTWQHTYPQGISEHLTAYQLSGKDGIGNIKFTGYFTPQLKVRKKQSKKYQYPIYAYPDNWEGPMPTRAQIDGGKVLKGRGLELAYAERLVDIYYMQLQGSGLVQYRNGKTAYFGFAASNKHPYSSIGTYISNNADIPLRNISMGGIKSYLKFNPDLIKPILFTNPSYVFFEASHSKPLGAGHVPLTEDISIAVDKRYIPLGSTLLAAVPVLDDKGKFSHHEYKILLAQDVGGAIRGKGHVDLYGGIGKEGQQKASAFHHYGQLWLLLPKGSEEVGPVISNGSWVDN